MLPREQVRTARSASEDASLLPAVFQQYQEGLPAQEQSHQGQAPDSRIAREPQRVAAVAPHVADERI
jgi:hypothetical protein